MISFDLNALPMKNRDQWCAFANGVDNFTYVAFPNLYKALQRKINSKTINIKINSKNINVINSKTVKINSKGKNKNIQVIWK